MMSQYSPDWVEIPIALVAEGNDIIRRQVADHLRNNGFEVLEAKTSVDALLMALDYPDPIIALFTSLELRKYCNGAELASCLRAVRPEMSVFYLGDGDGSMEEIFGELIQGDAVLLGIPLTTPGLDEAIAWVEESRAQAGFRMESMDWT